jgi:L-cysteine:1D-myo-inositol 2-amino-2-deoxy-alpha-D-glucopyranoside ligase
MSKSRGNLVLVSKLRAAGVDPMAIRLALLAHHHTQAWEWQDKDIDTATEQLARWRSALSRAAGPAADPLIVELRTSLRDGLDAPAALAAMDTWVSSDGTDETAPARVAAAIDALLGIV